MTEVRVCKQYYIKNIAYLKIFEYSPATVVTVLYYQLLHYNYYLYQVKYLERAWHLCTLRPANTQKPNRRHTRFGQKLRAMFDFSAPKSTDSKKLFCDDDTSVCTNCLHFCSYCMSNSDLTAD